MFNTVSQSVITRIQTRDDRPRREISIPDIFLEIYYWGVKNFKIF